MALKAQAPDRKVWRNAKKVASVLGSAVTATALTAGITAQGMTSTVYNPDVALAADAVELPTIATGPLLGALSNFVKTIPLLPGFELSTTWVNSNPQDLYNALNAIPLAPTPGGNAPCSLAKSTNCRTTTFLASGTGAFGVRDAINALWSAGSPYAGFPFVGDPYDGTTNLGNALGPGYSLLAGLQPGSDPDSAPAPADDSSVTDLVSIFLNSPLRLNGGIAARFAPLLRTFGIDTSAPTTGFTSNCGNGLNCDQYNAAADGLPDQYLFLLSNAIDLTWAYNPMADFPSTLNPFSLINTLLGTLPPSYLLTDGLSNFLKEANSQIGVNGSYTAPGINTSLGTALAIYYAGSIANLAGLAPETFLTLKNDDLPILSPLRLPSLIINSVLDGLAAAFAPLGGAGLPFRLGTPIADMLQPALKILVNIGYNDVVTPTDIANDPSLLEKGYCGLGGVCYDRTFAQTTTLNNTFRLFGNLTPQEMLQVPGDVIGALVTGIGQQLAKPFFGILEPAPCVSCTPTAAVAPRVAATVAAPSEADAPDPVGDPARTAVAAVGGQTATEAKAPVGTLAAITDTSSEVSEPRHAAAGKPRSARAPATATATARSSNDDNGGSPGRARTGRASR